MLSYQQELMSSKKGAQIESVRDKITLEDTRVFHAQPLSVCPAWGRWRVKPSQGSQLNTHFLHFLHHHPLSSVHYLLTSFSFIFFNLSHHFTWAGWDPCQYRSLSRPVPHTRHIVRCIEVYIHQICLLWSSTALFFCAEFGVISFAPNSWIMYQTLHALWLCEWVYALSH